MSLTLLFINAFRHLTHSKVPFLSDLLESKYNSIQLFVLNVIFVLNLLLKSWKMVSFTRKPQLLEIHNLPTDFTNLLEMNNIINSNATISYQPNC